MTVVVLHGEVSAEANKDEQDVLVQVAEVSEALSRLGFHPVSVPFSLDVRKTIETLKSLRPALIFNLVESVGGQGRLIHLAPTILDSLRLPYTGAKTEAMFSTSNKLLAKKLLRGAQIPTPPWFSLQDLDNAASVTEKAYIVKSVWEHASIGLDEGSVVTTASASVLREVLEAKRERLGGEGFVEAFIEGREFNLSILAGNQSPQVLPPAEIRFDAYPEDKLKIVDYRAKWEDDSFEYHHTPRRFDFPPEDEPLLERLKQTAGQCWHLFNLRGYARVDFRVDRNRTPWVLEVNANPCIAHDAGFFAAAKQAGLSFDEVVKRILRDSGCPSGVN